jgi:SAM-dependent methyltransferase
MSNLDFLRALRLLELEAGLKYFPAPRGKDVHVLELGAGAGWQAHHLELLGYQISAVDVAQSAYSNERVFPVLIYDGSRLPFADRKFDVVFSSNVLEHIDDLAAFLAETARVLAEGGVAVHILPTPAWRIWSSLLHPLWVIKRGIGIAVRADRSDGTESPGSNIHGGPLKAAFKRMANLVPHRHGERGNIWSEAYYFSRRFWLRQFRENGFRVLQTSTAGIFYTECEIFGAKLPIPIRRKLAGLMGSTCDIYYLTLA